MPLHIPPAPPVATPEDTRAAKASKGGARAVERSSVAAVLLQGTLNAVDQSWSRKGLRQEIERACLTMKTTGARSFMAHSCFQGGGAW
jgi:hypothetical protein